MSKYGGGKFLKEAPFSLILVEFEGVDSYLMAEYRPKEILNLKRMKKEFRRNPHFDIRDVYFVPVG